MVMILSDWVNRHTTRKNQTVDWRKKRTNINVKRRHDELYQKLFIAVWNILTRSKNFKQWRGLTEQASSKIRFDKRICKFLHRNNPPSPESGLNPIKISDRSNFRSKWPIFDQSWTSDQNFSFWLTFQLDLRSERNFWSGISLQPDWKSDQFFFSGVRSDVWFDLKKCSGFRSDLETVPIGAVPIGTVPIGTAPIKSVSKSEREFSDQSDRKISGRWLNQNFGLGCYRTGEDSPAVHFH